MIITEHKVENYISIGEEDYIEAGIDADSLPLFFELMSKAIYSNPIGSICREITSNAYDANVENNKDSELVVVSLNDEFGQYSIEFKDKGVGFTEQRIRKVFMNYLSSTKRGSNKQIGGFGLGSKSVLSYKDYFNITTVSENVLNKYIRKHNKKHRDNIKLLPHIYYEYVYHTGEIKPRIELLIKKTVDEETKKIIAETGTIIKIDIDNYADFLAFKSEIQNQTCYFDNVYVIGLNSNNYKIYNKQYYKYRNNYQYSQVAHILLGNVAYPINWEELNISILKIPIGIKFEIGELQVTPNRENIRYTNEAKELIKERLTLAREELISEFNSQNPKIDNFAEYLDKRDNLATLQFDNDTNISLSNLNISNKYVYTPLEDVHIPSDCFFAYRRYSIKNGNISKKSNWVHERDFRYSLFAHRGFNIYDNIYHNNHRTVISPSAMSKKDKYFMYCRNLKLENQFKRGHIEHKNLFESVNQLFRKQVLPDDIRLKLRDETITQYRKRVKKWVIENPYEVVKPLGKAIKIRRYMIEIENYIKSISYEYYVVNEQWIENYKNQKKITNRLKNKERVETVRYFNTYNVAETKEIDEFRKYVFVFYREKEEEDNLKEKKLKNYDQLMNESSSTWKDKILFISLQKTNLQKLKSLNNLYHIDTFFKIKKLYNFFKKAQIANKIRNRTSDLSIYLLGRISEYHYNKYLKVKNFASQFKSFNFETELNNVAKISKLKLTISEDFKTVVEFNEKLSILQYINSNIPSEYLLQILKPYKLKHLNESLWKTSKLSKLGKTSS